MIIQDKSPKQLAKEIKDKLYSIIPFQEQESMEIAEYFLKYIQEIQHYWDGMEGHSYSYWTEVIIELGLENNH